MSDNIIEVKKSLRIAVFPPKIDGNHHYYRYANVNRLYELDSETDKDGQPLYLTIADYYYEMIQLMMIERQKRNETTDDNTTSSWIEVIDWFRELIKYILSEDGQLNKKCTAVWEIQQEGWLFLNSNFGLRRECRVKTFFKNLIEEISKKICTFFFQDDASIVQKKGKDLCEDLKKLINFLNDNKIFISNIKKRYFEGGSCVCFAIDKTNNYYYFSLSGAANDCIPNQSIGKDVWIYELKYEYRLLKEAISGVYKNAKNIVDCHLTENVRRYVECDCCSMINGKKTYIINGYLPNPIEFVNDINNAANINQKSAPYANRVTFKRHYSCCERKILANIVGYNNPDYATYVSGKTNNILTGFQFFDKYPPCELCMPALVGCDDIVYGGDGQSYIVHWNGKEFEMCKKP